jgi:hypothetical protein
VSGQVGDRETNLEPEGGGGQTTLATGDTSDGKVVRRGHPPVGWHGEPYPSFGGP